MQHDMILTPRRRPRPLFAHLLRSDFFFLQDAARLCELLFLREIKFTDSQGVRQASCACVDSGREPPFLPKPKLRLTVFFKRRGPFRFFLSLASMRLQLMPLCKSWRRDRTLLRRLSWS